MRSGRLLILPLALALSASVVTLPGPSASSGPSRVYLPFVARSYFLANQRFGVIASGDLGDAPAQLASAWWFTWGQPTPGGPYHRVGQVSLRTGGQIARVPLATLQDGARQSPGGYWLIGNEPNVPGQDNLSPAEYAGELKYYADAIKGADPTARLVGPNVLDFDFTCSGCLGFTSGHAWLDGFRSAWAGQYGGEPPLDVWGLHAYLITWDKLPMTDYATVQAQLAAFADYLAAIPAQAGKPVWLTEFGIIWGYPGYATTSSGCAQAPNCVAPVGDFAASSIRTYLDQMLSWLTINAARYRIDKWFVYTTYGQPEPYTTTYGGISLLSGPGAGLSDLGQLYRQYATR